MAESEGGRRSAVRGRKINFHRTPAWAIVTSMGNITVDAAEILNLVEPRFGFAERARRWFEKEPLPGFSQQTAQQLVQAGRGVEVRRYLAAVDAGIHS